LRLQPSIRFTRTDGHWVETLVGLGVTVNINSLFVVHMLTNKIIHQQYKPFVGSPSIRFTRADSFDVVTLFGLGLYSSSYSGSQLMYEAI
jgi:hypothetical protein